MTKESERESTRDKIVGGQKIDEAKAYIEQYKNTAKHLALEISLSHGTNKDMRSVYENNSKAEGFKECLRILGIL